MAANWRQMLGSWISGDRKGNSSLELFRQIYGATRESSAGPVITVEAALGSTVVLAIMRVLADGVAQPPFRLMRDDGATKSAAKDHPHYQLVFRRPNSWQTSFEFRETMMFHTGLTNNCYIYKNRVGIARRIVELIPLDPATVTVERRADMTLSYKVRQKSGEVREYTSDEIWHLRGPSWNGFSGMDAIRLARNAIGLGLAIEQGQAEFQRNGARTTGMVSVAGSLTEPLWKRLEAYIERYALSGERSGKPMIMDQDAKFTPFTMSGVDQQLLETRKHQVEEICRAFRVMPIMIGQSDKAATYASAEQMFIAHVTHTLMPWYERIEQSADVNLLTDEERAQGYYFKFQPNALMRGAAKDRAEFYAKALGAGGGKGWMNQNEVRSLEELDRSDDPAADELPQPAATTQADLPKDPSDAP